MIYVTLQRKTVLSFGVCALYVYVYMHICVSVYMYVCVRIF